MTKEQEDKIIQQAQDILERRSANTIYFSETGGGMGKVSIQAYIIKPNGEKAYYRNDGNENTFSCTLFDGLKCDASELPKEMLFSFRHGISNFEVDESLKGYKWKLEDLKYEVIDEDEWNKEQQNLKSALAQIDSCKTISDVYDLYDKYLRNRHIPYEVIGKAFKIFKHEPDMTNIFNGEIGAFAFEQTFLFVSIMEEYGHNKTK